MRNNIKLFYMIAVVLIILIPVCTFNRQKNYFSYIDNRYLAELSENASLDQLEYELDSYTSDRIGLRDWMMSVYSDIHIKWLDYFSHPDYDMGKEGEIFPNIIENQEYDDYRQMFVKAVSAMNTYCQSRNISFYLMFDPNKISIYTEFIPDGINYDSSWVDEFLNALTESGVTVVDNYHYFKSIKDEVRLYNVKEDVTHWNDIGAFYGCNLVLKTISEDYPAVTENKLEDFEVTEEFAKYLQNSTIVINETIPKIKVPVSWSEVVSREREALQTDTLFANFLHVRSDLAEAADLPKILSFEGSYMFGGDHHNMLICQSREYIAVHNYRNVLNLPYYVNIFQPEIVIFDVAEFVIAEYFFSYDVMKTINYPVSLTEFGYPYEEKEMGNVNVSSFIDTYEQIYIDIGNTDYENAYVISGDKTYDLTVQDEVYYLITLRENLENYPTLRFVFPDPDAEKCYYQDYYPEGSDW